MSQLNVDTIKKADGTGNLSVPAETGTLVIKDGSNDVTLNDITAGGIYLGGTGAANYLDDYEEGTWTPTYTASGSNPTITYHTSTSGEYSKIGNIVVCRGTLRTDSVSGGSGSLNIAGLPFGTLSSPTVEAGYGMVHIFVASNGSFAGEHPLSGQTVQASTYARLFYRSSVTGGTIASDVSDLISGSSSGQNFLKFMIIYRTSA